jgi:hypothetical protein
MIETEDKVQTLTALDRCDAGDCNAQAYVHVKGVTGELFFCGHHYGKADKEKLEAFSFEIIDERERLIDNRLKGSEN